VFISVAIINTRGVIIHWSLTLHTLRLTVIYIYFANQAVRHIYVCHLDKRPGNSSCNNNNNNNNNKVRQQDTYSPYRGALPWGLPPCDLTFLESLRRADVKLQ